MDWLDNIITHLLRLRRDAEVLPQLLAVGLVNTLIISVAATVIGIVLGMVIAIMGISPSTLAARSRPASTPTSSAACPRSSPSC